MSEETIKIISLVVNFVLAGLTGFYVWLTHQLLKSTQKSSNENLRPFVVVSLPLKGVSISLSIKNVGQRPAHDVTIEMTPSPQELIKL